ncbi:MAG: P-type conjugative transfer protein TrbG, partial [Pseudoxanthomonas sp.]
MAAEMPVSAPLPGQLKPLPAPKPAGAKPNDPKREVIAANRDARIEPAGEAFINATQVWPYSAGALYQVYASPGRVSDIALEAGEQLVSVSAGDTVRWIIGDTMSGTGAEERVHVLVKPTRNDLQTNLVISTNRRSYYLELTATPQTWMASVSWQYPGGLVQSARQRESQAQDQVAAEGVALEHLQFRYDITGDKPAWRPVRAFDDGQKVYIQFPDNIGQGELPPLFVVGNTGETQLVNYRVRSPYYIVDRLFDAAELRLGGDKAQVVRISRTEGKMRRSIWADKR